MVEVIIVLFQLGIGANGSFWSSALSTLSACLFERWVGIVGLLCYPVRLSIVISFLKMVTGHLEAGLRYSWICNPSGRCHRKSCAKDFAGLLCLPAAFPAGAYSGICRWHAPAEGVGSCRHNAFRNFRFCYSRHRSRIQTAWVSRRGSRERCWKTSKHLFCYFGSKPVSVYFLAVPGKSYLFPACYGGHQ